MSTSTASMAAVRAPGTQAATPRYWAAYKGSSQVNALIKDALKQRIQRQRPSTCRAASSSTSTVVSPAAEPTTVTASGLVDADATWQAFAASVSGEWEGVTASFDVDGSPIPLPEYYVPQAYRDWGVELFDWQSQSSMLADAAGLAATSRRMMPTVGCEADAVAFTQEAAQLFATAPGGPAPTVAPDGSYSAGLADIAAHDCFKAAFEHCLQLPAEEQGGEQQQGRRRRLRVVHNLRRAGGERPWRLDSVEVHQERYDSPYRGKLELSGCGGGLKGFATSEQLGADALAGPWRVVSGLRYAADAATAGCSCTAAVPGEPWAAEELPAGLLLHPLRAWSACETSGEDGRDVSLAAGALLDGGGGTMAVATRRLVGGRLAGVELLVVERA